MKCTSVAKRNRILLLSVHGNTEQCVLPDTDEFHRIIVVSTDSREFFHFTMRYALNYSRDFCRHLAAARGTKMYRDTSCFRLFSIVFNWVFSKNTRDRLMWYIF